MPDYVYDRAGILRDVVTEQEAKALYEEAAALAGSDLDGDLETGFHFWGVVEPYGAKLIRCHVTPITAAH